MTDEKTPGNVGRSGPLAGLKVVEMAGIGPGPFACMVLADHGAEVIRVDRIPRADPSEFAKTANRPSIVDRGRSSIAVNMKDPRGVALALDLIATADVLVEGYRPGVMERLGLGPAECLQRNARLVYGRMTGWGQSGPLAQTAGHDINYIALTGALHAMGPADRPPSPPLNLVGDYGGGGMLLAFGVLAAVLEARSSGHGQVVDAAMSDGAALLMAPIYGMLARGAWTDAREQNFLDGAAHFYGTYRCSDGGYLAVGPIEPQFYRLLLELCEVRDSDFSAQWDRARWTGLRKKLEGVFASRTRDQWSALLEGTDACVAPVLSMQEAPLHPHNQARRTFDSSRGAWEPAPAPRFERTPSSLPPPAPDLGGQSRAILRGLGHEDSAIDGLLAAGVIHT
ncbi:MAG: CaiB/BaiF CoA transferase family protein [Ramlibacter sp.]